MTTFQAPLKIVGKDGITGNSVTDTQGYTHCTKVISLAGGSTAPRQIVTLPSNAMLTNLRAFATSAFAADVSAVSVSWGNSADATHYGTIAVSAVGQVRGATVSAAGEFDAGGTIIIVASAVSTTTFTTGGVRAFVEYVVTE